MLEAALRFLEARARSESEVRRRLGQAGYRSELVDGAITRLVELGVLDDEAFARAWVESRDRARPRGERALRRELSLKGVDRAVLDEVLDERRDEAAGAGRDIDLEAARLLLARSARSLERIVRSAGSVASGRTRYSPGTASTRTSAARRAASSPPRPTRAATRPQRG